MQRVVLAHSGSFYSDSLSLEEIAGAVSGLLSEDNTMTRMNTTFDDLHGMGFTDEDFAALNTGRKT